MKKSWAMKWVKALRSGKYKQGKHFLRRGDEYCCLGVLCEITKTSRRMRYGKLYEYKGNAIVIPHSVRGRVGMNTLYGRLPRARKAGEDLAQLNDSGKYSFKQIARIIEKYWRDL